MKTNAHRPSHRNRWLLLSNKVLTKEELLLFEYYVDQMDFDVSHQTFGTFKVDFPTIAQLFGYSPKHPCNALREKHDRLVALGFIHPSTNKNVFLIHNPKRYIAATKKWQGEASEYEKNERHKELKEFVQNVATNVHFTEQDIQSTEQFVHLNEQTTPFSVKSHHARSLVSSKDEYLSDAVNSMRSKRSLADYEQIYQEGNYQGLVPEDMKWLDDHYDAHGRYVP